MTVQDVNHVGSRITLEQLRALDALAQAGSLLGAARLLGKAHTAVLHGLRQLETGTQLVLMDRSGYRLGLTPAAHRLRHEARRILDATRSLEEACAQMRTGWEPSVRVVFDGIHPSAALLAAVGALARDGAPTQIRVSAEYLGGVEEAFIREDAQLMIAVLPPRMDGLRSVRLAPVRARLVAHTRHPLARARGRLDDAALSEHVLVTVRGGDPRLALPTAHLESRATVHLNDFHAKREAILAGLGYGWLPDHLCAREIATGRLRVLPFVRGHEHVFQPRLYLRRDGRPGRATERLLHALSPTAESRD